MRTGRDLAASEITRTPTAIPTTWCMPRTASGTTISRPGSPPPPIPVSTSTWPSSAAVSPGCTAAYTYLKERPDARVLIFDNHPIFGGEARQNEFLVDGHRLWGPQGSTGAVWPIEWAEKIGMHSHLWEELGLPLEFEWQEARNSQLKIPMDTYSPMHPAWEADRSWLVRGWPRNGGQSLVEPFQGRAVRRPHQARPDLDGAVPPAAGTGGLGAVAGLDDLQGVHRPGNGHRQSARRRVSQPLRRGDGLRSRHGRHLRLPGIQFHPAGREPVRAHARQRRPDGLYSPGKFPRRQYRHSQAHRPAADSGCVRRRRHPLPSAVQPGQLAVARQRGPAGADAARRPGRRCASRGRARQRRPCAVDLSQGRRNAQG